MRWRPFDCVKNATDLFLLILLTHENKTSHCYLFYTYVGAHKKHNTINSCVVLFCLSNRLDCEILPIRRNYPLIPIKLTNIKGED